LASDAGEPPDIICSGHEHIGDWATAGYLLDITDDISKYPEFEDVVDSLWTSTELNGRRWGVPQDAEARPLYWSKPLLRQLGWSEEEIESLPDRIKSAEFTWQDMLDTAEAAVQAGVVEPGNGWWHRPQNGPDFLYYYLAAGGTITEEGSDALIFEKEPHLKVFRLLHEATQARNIMRPDVLSGDYPAWRERTAPFDRIAFVFGGTWRWADWYTNFLQEVGGEDYLFENVGFGLIPANEEGTGQPITLTHPLVYMISSQSEHPDLALLLVSKATVKELNTTYAIESGHLGILKSQSDYTPYTTAPFLTQTLYMLDYTTFLPNSPYWSGYSEAWFNGIKAVESGDLSPEEAIDFVVEQMETSLGDGVIIR
jgi:inositol-phosphate transport system substrate-binding protein